MQDGADYLIEESKKVEQEEEDLLKLIQDRFDINNPRCLAWLDLFLIYTVVAFLINILSIELRCPSMPP